MKAAIRNADPAPEAGNRTRDAWSAFWADAVQSHCVAGAPGIWRPLAGHWALFAASLAAKTPVLDLGCGVGVVGKWLLAERPDLRITGIDSASVTRQLDPRLELVPDVAMEALPFADQRFGAVVSQFGFEYSRTGAAASELARVLRPGGVLSLLVHHADSAVVSANDSRAAALGGLLAEPLRAAFCCGDGAQFQSLLSELRQRHPGDALLAELGRSLPPRLGRPAEQRVATWKAIEEALAPESCVVEALAASCVSEERLDQWLEPLHGVCELTAVSVLRDSDGRPIAWKIEGARPART
jgi:SAM-dependent methyltransferase